MRSSEEIIFELYGNSFYHYAFLHCNRAWKQSWRWEENSKSKRNAVVEQNPWTFIRVDAYKGVGETQPEGVW